MYVFLLGSYFPFTYVFDAFFGILSPFILRRYTLLFCLQMRRSGLDSRHYQKKKVVGLERGPLILSTTEELFDRKVVAPV
jgi:hypothetical protein